VIRTYIAKYLKSDSGYLGQLIDWPEATIEGRDLEECRAMIRDVLAEMVHAYRRQGRELPRGDCIMEPISIHADADADTDNLSCHPVRCNTYT